jgi:hypothetical protein
MVKKVRTDFQYSSRSRIQLNGIEPLSIVLEPRTRWQVCGIKRGAPMPVKPTRTADVKLLFGLIMSDVRGPDCILLFTCEPCQMHFLSAANIDATLLVALCGALQSAFVLSGSCSVGHEIRVGRQMMRRALYRL